MVTTASAPITLAIGQPRRHAGLHHQPRDRHRGVATFAGCAITGTAGSYTLSTTGPGLTTGTSTSLTISAGTATQLVIATEPSATENSGAALAQQPVVKVED